jgi:hypothetical protein
MRKALVAGLVASAALVLLSPPEAAAQARSWSDPTGFHVGVNANDAAITYEDDTEAEAGAGYGLSVGWGLTNLLTLYLEGSGATVETLDGLDTYTLAHADLGARFNFRSAEKRFRPYALVAYSGIAAGMEIGGDLFTISGAGPSFGGGIAYFISRKIAVDLGLKATSGSFTEAEYRGNKKTIDVSATSARLGLGVSFWTGHH